MLSLVKTKTSVGHCKWESNNVNVNMWKTYLIGCDLDRLMYNVVCVKLPRRLAVVSAGGME